MNAAVKPSDELLVVVTRAAEQSQELLSQLSRRGVSAVSLPAISFRVLELDNNSRSMLSSLENGSYEWLIFTSQNGVRVFQELSNGSPAGNLRNLGGLKIACQGESTRQELLQRFARDSDLMPESALQESLAADLARFDLRGKRILLATASSGREVLVPLLQEQGAIVDRWSLYETVPLDFDRAVLDRIAQHDPAALVYLFFSPSALEACLANFSERDKNVLKQSKIVSIGPVTSAALAKSGLTCNFEAGLHNEQGVLQIIDDILGGR